MHRIKTMFGTYDREFLHLPIVVTEKKTYGIIHVNDATLLVNERQFKELRKQAKKEGY